MRKVTGHEDNHRIMKDYLTNLVMGFLVFMENRVRLDFGI